MEKGKALNFTKGALYAPLPIPAFQVLSNATEYAAQKVLLALVMHMGKNSNCVWPSYTQIAQNVGISRNTISKGLTVLYDFGFIRIGRFPQGKQWRSRYYLQECCWNSGLMKSEAKKHREKKYRCFACLKRLDRGDFGMSGDQRIHFGCGGFVIPAVVRKPRNNSLSGGGISQSK
jgi:DNA-binding transcriptional ArsR family regulator